MIYELTLINIQKRTGISKVTVESLKIQFLVTMFLLRRVKLGQITMDNLREIYLRCIQVSVDQIWTTHPLKVVNLDYLHIQMLTFGQ